MRMPGSRGRKYNVTSSLQRLDFFILILTLLLQDDVCNILTYLSDLILNAYDWENLFKMRPCDEEMGEKNLTGLLLRIVTIK